MFEELEHSNVHFLTQVLICTLNFESCTMNAMTAIERPCSGKHTVPRSQITALLWAAVSKHSCACKGYGNFPCLALQCWFRLFLVLFNPFLLTKCVHRQNRPIDVSVPKGDPFLVGDWCFRKGQNQKIKSLKRIHRLCEAVLRNPFGSM